MSGKKSVNPHTITKKANKLTASLKQQPINNHQNNYLSLIKASQHNLKDLNIDFPLGKLICVTGVSGSGKSTLIHDTLYPAIKLGLKQKVDYIGKFKKLNGIDNIDKVYLIDQSPIGRTPRSNPATYTKSFDYIRKIYSQTKDAKMRGFLPGRFSFNVKGGRCESCQGGGQVKISMQFLSDVYVTCEVCQGKRYNAETLAVKYQNMSISDTLNLTINQAYTSFSHFPALSKRLATLKAVGLGYIKLGQPAPTLSGGEAQRVKLAKELSLKSTGHTVYLLDEPTTGLHFEDVKNLLIVLKQLISHNNTVIIIEHNLDVIKNSDWIIDLGPEGGDLGGNIVAQGTVEDIINLNNGHTSKYLQSN